MDILINLAAMKKNTLFATAVGLEIHAPTRENFTTSKMLRLIQRENEKIQDQNLICHKVKRELLMQF